MLSAERLNELLPMGRQLIVVCFLKWFSSLVWKAFVMYDRVVCSSPAVIQFICRLSK
jgi:hypothetical protein